MASAKSTTTATTRRSSKRNGSADAEAEISPARWAGVALVIAALMGAIALAMMSPSDPDGGPAQDAVLPGAVPTPGPTVLDTRVPTVRPTITSPASGVETGEWEIMVDIDVPEEPLRSRLLSLVVLREGEIIGSVERPTTGGAQEVSARLLPGLNVISAALQGPGGLLGPTSEEISITLDKEKPRLELTAPQHKLKTFDDTVEVQGSSEAGAEIFIVNEASGYDPGPFVVGPAGTFDEVVPLKKGRNQIVVRSEDEAGQEQRARVVVTRKDGKPVIELTAPQRVKRSSLPRKVKIVVKVTDTTGEPMAGAAVSYSIGGDNRTAETFSDETGSAGRSTWSPEINGTGSPVLVGVEVRSPYGQTRRAKHEIELK